MKSNLKKSRLKSGLTFKKLIFLVLLLIVACLLAFILFFNNDNVSTLNTNDNQSDQSNTKKTEDSPPEGQVIEQNAPPNTNVGAEDYRLLVENERFKIRKSDNNYIITLYAIINRPDQYDDYQQQLKDYKAQALDYLKQNGYNYTSGKVTYEPDEAKDL